ncbi:hypothetical protein Tco_0241031 [Tanacetum coccineum]
MAAKDSMATQRCELSREEFDEFLSSYPIPTGFDVILPSSSQTILDALPGYIEMSFKDFIFTKDDEDLTFIPKDSPPTFNVGSPSASINKEPVVEPVFEPMNEHAEVTANSGESPKGGMFVVHSGSVTAQIKERKCKIRGGSSKPPMKRKLGTDLSSSRAVRAKTFVSKDFSPALSISDEDEGFLDNHLDVNLLDLYDRCYARQAVVGNAVNRRSRKLLKVIEKLRCEADVMRAKESQKWAGYQENLSALESVVASLEADKARLKAAEASLQQEVEKLIGKLVSSAITLGKCKAFEQVVSMKELFDLAKVRGYCSLYKEKHEQASNDLTTDSFAWLNEFTADASAPLEILLSKKPPKLKRPAQSKTHAPAPSSQKATSSSAPHVKSLSPPTDTMKPTP